MIETLKTLDAINAYNTLNYPLIIIDKEYNILWSNEDFKEKIKKNEFIEQATSKIKTMDKHIFELNDIFYEAHTSKIQINNSDLTVVSFFNISKRKRLEEKLINRQKMFELLSEQLPEAIVVFSHKILYTNPAFEKMLDLSGDCLIDTNFYDLLDEKNRKKLQSNINELVLNKKQKVESVLQLSKKDGNKIWVNITTEASFEEKKTVFINVIKDITVQKIEKEKLEYLANVDKLTNIYNRRKFEELLTLEYKRDKRYKRMLSAIFFDIDDFKKINDSYGHDIGDEVLRKISKVISSMIRETDIFARWGGEEFIILLPETSKEVALLVAEAIRKTVATEPFNIVSQVTISLGITQLKHESLKEFLKRLDKALYIAKGKGKNTSTIL